MKCPKFKGWDTARNKMYSAEELGKDQLTLSVDGRGFVNVAGVSTRLSQFMEHILPLQSVGRCDKYGEEIYQDDIVGVHYIDDDDGNKKKVRKGVVKKGDDDGNFYWTGEYADWSWNEMFVDHSGRLEVLGNIHENPGIMPGE